MYGDIRSQSLYNATLQIVKHSSDAGDERLGREESTRCLLLPCILPAESSINGKVGSGEIV